MSPLEAAAREISIYEGKYHKEFCDMAAEVVRAYLIAKIEEMEHPRPDSVYFEGCDGEAIGVSVPVKDVLAALLPVVSEDGGANQ